MPTIALALVARSVGKKEMMAEAKAEWATMHERVWDLNKVREKSEIIREAKKEGKTVQFGRVHGICVEKNAGLPAGHPNRKYKGRVVFLGNRVTNQDFEGATFAELGNAPGNLESVRFADAYGCSRGMLLSMRMRSRPICKPG